MKTVYCIAFLGERFLMVYNHRRRGWEMPGGKVEPGESDREAVVREFHEESGRDVTVLGDLGTDDGKVFCGEVGEAVGPGEMETRFFDELPDALAFPGCEYNPLIVWARDVVRGHRA